MENERKTLDNIQKYTGIEENEVILKLAELYQTSFKNVKEWLTIAKGDTDVVCKLLNELMKYKNGNKHTKCSSDDTDLDILKVKLDVKESNFKEKDEESVLTKETNNKEIPDDNYTNEIEKFLNQSHLSEWEEFRNPKYMNNLKESIIKNLNSNDPLSVVMKEDFDKTNEDLGKYTQTMIRPPYNYVKFNKDVYKELSVGDVIAYYMWDRWNYFPLDYQALTLGVIPIKNQDKTLGVVNILGTDLPLLAIKEKDFIDKENDATSEVSGTKVKPVDWSKYGKLSEIKKMNKDINDFVNSDKKIFEQWKNDSNSDSHVSDNINDNNINDKFDDLNGFVDTTKISRQVRNQEYEIYQKNENSPIYLKMKNGEMLGPFYNNAQHRTKALDAFAKDTIYTEVKKMVQKVPNIEEIIAEVRAELLENHNEKLSEEGEVYTNKNNTLENFVDDVKQIITTQKTHPSIEESDKFNFERSKRLIDLSSDFKCRDNITNEEIIERFNVLNKEVGALASLIGMKMGTPLEPIKKDDKKEEIKNTLIDLIKKL